MIIRKAGIKDISSISSIHHYAFDKNHFSSLLPEEMLTGFYSNLLESNNYNYIALGEDNQILGFIVAGMNTRLSIDTFIKQNPVKLFLVLLKNPKFWFEKLTQFLKKFKSKKVFNSVAGLRLLSIAVKKDSIHKGIGTELLRYFEKELIEDEIFTYGLSVKKHNKSAIQFYFKNNFEIEKDEKEAIYFIKKLNDR